MEIVPEYGGESQHTLTNVPYFDATIPVTIGDRGASGAYREYLEAKRDAVQFRATKINTRQLMASQQRCAEMVAKDGQYEVTINADLVHVKVFGLTHYPAGKSSTDGKRGNVVGFSRRSRKRLIEFMASVRHDGDMLFLTLTYPDKFPVDRETWFRHFEAFRRRLERMSPEIAVIWRKELVERKSGKSQGI